MQNQDPADLIQQGNRCFDRGDYRGAIVRLEEAAALARAQGQGQQRAERPVPAGSRMGQYSRL